MAIPTERALQGGRVTIEATNVKGAWEWRNGNKMQKGETEGGARIPAQCFVARPWWW
jgi:hypothetical protein